MPASVLSFAVADPAVTAQVTVSYRGSTGLQRLELTGAQTYTVDLAMMPAAGLRGLHVTVDDHDAAGAPVTTPIRIGWTSNAISKSEELSPGGVFQIASPRPVAGITALSIITTANAVVHLAALG